LALQVDVLQRELEGCGIDNAGELIEKAGAERAEGWLWVYREKIGRGEDVTVRWLARKILDQADPPARPQATQHKPKRREGPLERYRGLVEQLSGNGPAYGPSVVLGAAMVLERQGEEVTAKAVRARLDAKEKRRREEHGAYVRNLRAFAEATGHEAAGDFADYLEESEKELQGPGPYSDPRSDPRWRAWNGGDAEGRLRAWLWKHEREAVSA
jgi:hypothetical protein